MEYKELDPKTLKKLHETGFEILTEVDRICQKYKIPYFLCGGTLLGSIRHKGFIPWDDDIDVGMLRPDYERFIECFIKEKNEKYFLQNFSTDKNYWCPFMKIRKNNTTINEKFIENIDCHKGIFLDIFPFDIVPDQGFTFGLKIRSFLIKVIVEAIFCKRKIYKPKDSRRPFFTWCACLFNTKSLIKIQNKLMTKYKNKNYKHCICFVGTYNTSKEYIKISDIFPTTKGVFETKEFQIPVHYDVYLKNLYNDYMQLPPKEKRRNHNAVLIDFEKGKTMINEELK